MSKETTLLNVQSVCKVFSQPDASDIEVLRDVSLTLNDGEIVALLGRSGSGKSTLLRIISGLTQPSSGQVLWQDQPVIEPVAGISMVFQSFGLFPWLTVLQNVELGLIAKNIPTQKRRELALNAIDVVGMDGFESAYPKELSGGMCQRVGFARALVVNPDVLLLDEPFSALDVLTTDNLRNDLLDLWHSQKSAIRSMLLVTHSIEEAVIMADRILIFSTNPGSIYQEIPVDIPHPREHYQKDMTELVSHLYQQIVDASKTSQTLDTQTHRPISLYHRLPDIEISELTGLLETLLSPTEHLSSLSDLAEVLHLDVDELFPLTEALELLRLAHVHQNELIVTQLGILFEKASVLDRKRLFAQQLLSHIPLARHIRRVLDSRPNHTAYRERFVSELQDHLTEEAAQQVLTTLIDWARYAEIFAYDDKTEQLSLDNPS